MQNDIYLIGEVGFDVNLQTVIKAVEASNRQEPLNIHIHSVGGYVYDGLAIYNYLKNLDQEVHTHSAGVVASIASIIFLAGKKETRTINENDNFLIHLPSSWGEGNAEDIEKAAKNLREMEAQLSKIYANETDLTEEEAMDLMKEDQFMDHSFLKEKGFVSEIITIKATANFNKNPKKMSTLSKEDKGFFNTAFTKIENLLTSLKSGPTAKMITDAAGMELEFPDVAEDATPAVGDKATVDGKPAEGDYTLPSGEVYVFVAGELTEIKEEEEEEEEDDTAEALLAENTALKQKIKDLEEATASISEEFKKVKAKVSSTFKYTGKTPNQKTPGAEEDAVRSFHGPKA